MNTRNQAILRAARVQLFRGASKKLKSFIESIRDVGLSGVVDSIPKMYFQEMTKAIADYAKGKNDAIKQSICKLALGDLSSSDAVKARLEVCGDYCPLKLSHMLTIAL